MTKPIRWVITLMLIIWALVPSTWVIWRVFGDNPPDIPAGTAAAFATLFTLPGIGIALWKWRVERDRPN